MPTCVRTSPEIQNRWQAVSEDSGIHLSLRDCLWIFPSGPCLPSLETETRDGIIENIKSRVKKWNKLLIILSLEAITLLLHLWNGHKYYNRIVVLDEREAILTFLYIRFLSFLLSILNMIRVMQYI